MAAQTQAVSRRVYEDWPGNDTFFCQGRCHAGPGWTALLGTTLLILAPAGVFLGLVLPPVAKEYGQVLLAFGLWLPLVSIVTLWATGCADPGIIPRIPPPEADEFPNGRPRTKEVEINGKKVQLKWNDSCNFYQPPRAHHCSVNNDCIEKFDHHCPWRNYRTFLLFVINTTLLCCYVFALCIMRMHLLHKYSGASVLEAMRRAPAALACICFTFLGVWFVAGLSGFHGYLVSTNQTTYENFRYSYGRGENPYDVGCLCNCIDVWCTPRVPRKVDFRAFITDVEAAPPVVNREGRATGSPPVAGPGCCGGESPRVAQAGEGGAVQAPQAPSVTHAPLETQEAMPPPDAVLGQI